jgi:endonuclease IV
MARYGCHTDITEYSIQFLKQNNMDCLQLMPGGQLSYAPGDIQDKLALAKANNIGVVFHAPLCCYAISDNPRTTFLTMRYLVALDEQVKKFDSSKGYCVVLHAGSYSDLSKHTRMDLLIDFCTKFLDSTSNLVLCIENDVGSSRGTRVGDVLFLYSLCKKMNNPRIKLCVDTNHAWGHESLEFDVTSLDHWDKISDEIRVIHLNCIPPECPRYGHRDRHSDNLIQDSGDNAYWLLRLYAKNYKAFYITERSTLELSAEDYRWLRFHYRGFPSQ